MSNKNGMVSLEVSSRDFEIICAALEAVSPTGGGSVTFHLIGRLKLMVLPWVLKDSQKDAYHNLVGHLQGLAHEEYMEAFELLAVKRALFYELKTVASILKRVLKHA